MVLFVSNNTAGWQGVKERATFVAWDSDPANAPRLDITWSSEPGWLSGWSYRKSHEIGNATGAGTDYQIKITIHEGDGTDSGDDVYLNNSAYSFPYDLLITDNDGETELYHWVEGIEQYVLEEGGRSMGNRPWAVYYSGTYNRTYYGYLAYTDQKVYITYYDHDSRYWADPVEVGTVSSSDAHFSPAIAVSPHGQALTFDGTDNYVDFGSFSYNFTEAGGMSGEIWVKIPELSHVERYVLYNGWSEAGGWMLVSDYSAEPSIHENIAVQFSEVGGATESETVPYTIDEWTLIGWSWNGTHVSYYQNGQPYGTPDDIDSLCPTTNLHIGNTTIPAVTKTPFEGTIDGLRVYNRSLTDAEMLEHYQGTYNETGLILRLDFEGDYTDDSVEGNNGTPHGSGLSWGTGSTGGRIHIFYGPHSFTGNLWYQKSLLPENITSWNTRVDLQGSDNPTYLQPIFFPDGDIMVLYRNSVDGSSAGLKYLYSADSGSSWSKDTIVDFSTNYITYGRWILGESERIHLAWDVIDYADENERRDAYYAYSDDKGATWYNAGGGHSEAEISRAEGEAYYQVKNSGTEQHAIYDIDSDASNYPYLSATHWTATKTHHKLYAWSGASWSENIICNVTSGILTQSIDVVSSSEIYVYTVDEYDVWEYLSEDGGSTWSNTKNITEGGIDGDAYGCHAVVTNYQDELKLVYDRGPTGQGNDHEQYYFNDLLNQSGPMRTVPSETSFDVWIKVADDLSTSNQTIYVYYGYDGLIDSATDGQNTFIAWDDFDSQYWSGDNPKSNRGWTVEYASIEDNPAGRSGLGAFLDSQTHAGYERLIMNWTDIGSSPLENLVIHYDIYIHNAELDRCASLNIADNSGASVVYITVRSNAWLWYPDGGPYGAYTPACSVSEDTWYEEEEKIINTPYYHKFVDLTNDYTGGFRQSMVNGIDYVNFYTYVNEGYNFEYYIDDFFVRKFVLTEPSHGEWGEEEEAGSGNTPVNAGCAVTNLDLTDDIFAQLRTYIGTVNVTHADGYAEITTIDLTIQTGGATERVTFRYNEDTDTFSEQSGTTSVWELVTGSCVATKSGTTIDLEYHFRAEWNVTMEDNLDLKVTSTDGTGTDTDTYDLNIDVIHDLVISNFTMGDYRGDPGAIVTISGNCNYSDSSGGSTALYPPDSEFTKVQIWDADNNVEGTDNSIVNGYWELTITASSSIRNETFNPYIDMSDPHYTDAEEGIYEWYVSDGLKVASITNPTYKGSGAFNYTVQMVYAFNESEVVGLGEVRMLHANGTYLTTDLDTNSSGYCTFVMSQANATASGTYTIYGYSEPNYGITYTHTNQTFTLNSLGIVSQDAEANTLTGTTTAMVNGSTAVWSGSDTTLYLPQDTFNLTTTWLASIQVNSTANYSLSGNSVLNLACTAYPYVLESTRYWVASDGTIASTDSSEAGYWVSATFGSDPTGDILVASGPSPTYVLNCTYDLATNYTTYLALTLINRTTVRIAYDTWGGLAVQGITNEYLTAVSIAAQNLTMTLEGDGAGILYVDCTGRVAPQAISELFTSALYNTDTQLFTGGYTATDGTSLSLWISFVSTGGTPAQPPPGEGSGPSFFTIMVLDTTLTVSPGYIKTFDVMMEWSGATTMDVASVMFDPFEWFTLQDELPSSFTRDFSANVNTATVEASVHVGEDTDLGQYNVPVLIRVQPSGYMTVETTGYVYLSVVEPSFIQPGLVNWTGWLLGILLFLGLMWVILKRD